MRGGVASSAGGEKEAKSIEITRIVATHLHKQMEAMGWLGAL